MAEIKPYQFNLHTAPDVGAVLSDDRVYRYALWRKWNNGNPNVMFIGLNPSTADETEDDPTIRRIKNFASGFGYGGVVMVNLFAYRATKPERMLQAGRPIGRENNLWLIELARQCQSVCCAWGGKGRHKGQDEFVVRSMRHIGMDLWCLGKTRDGQPRHPLYVKADKVAEAFP